jgi:hypothetical protein
VPVTVSPTRRWPGLLPCHRVGPELLQRVLRKTRISEVLTASPSEYDWRRQERLLTTCLHSGRPVFNLILHSSELMAGGAPWIQDDAAVDALYDRLRRCIVWLRERVQVQFLTLGRIPEHLPSAEPT